VKKKVSWYANIDYAAMGVVAVLVTSMLGQLATAPNLAPWYAGLAKPSFNPPNWLFAPVWAVLYLLMAFAIWRMIRKPASVARNVALILFFLQLALNAAWSWLFFEGHSPLLGLVDIVPQFLIIVAAVIAFARLDWPAALALAPLAVWVGFAGLLNYELWRLNG